MTRRTAMLRMRLMKDRIKRLKYYLLDEREDLQDRLFVLLTIIALAGMLLASVGGLIIGENPVSLFATLGAFVLFSIIVYIGYRKHNIRISINILAVLLVFFFFPIVFFTSGGVYGGSPLWFVFAILYIGMIMRGALRIIFLVCEFIIAGLCYYLQYTRPELVVPHTVNEFYGDSLGSFIIVSIILSLLFSFQTFAYRRENKITRSQRDDIDSLRKAQNRFFSSMNHEIRTPINTIIGLNEMILREDISDEVAEDARNIQSSSKMLLNLINDILDMSRIQSGQMSLTLTPYRSEEILTDIVSMMEVRAEEKGLEFAVSASTELPTELLGDEVRIKQILINIINNSIKYTAKGQVKLTVQFEMRDGLPIIIYSVTDTGIGIKKESVPYLFTAYRRADEDKNKYIEGTGLGLYIVKQLVDLMGGRISVNSLYGSGTTFVIEIPQKIVDRKPMGELDIRKVHRSKSGKGYHQSFEAPEARVLAVDDTSTNLLVVSKLLRNTKVMIDTAGSGAEALAKTLEKEYHVILMDHLMPGMNGVECMHQIRTQTGGLSKGSKIVALTANAGREDRALYEREGFDGYMTKPVNGEALEAELIRLLPEELITVRTEEADMAELPDETAAWIQTDEKKKPVLITVTSVADIPAELIDKYDINVISITIETEGGCFRDGVDLDTNALLSYMEDRGRSVRIRSIKASGFERFFVDRLQYANTILHFSASSRVADTSYFDAAEAKKTFDNVTVFDTWQISGGQGILAVEACEMAEQGAEIREIVYNLERLKDKVVTSFIVESLDNLERSGQIGRGAGQIVKAFMIRPVIEMVRGRMKVRHLYFGSKEHAWRMYIGAALRGADSIDKRRLFVTHVGLSGAELDFIREEIEKKVSFEKIYFQMGSPGIAVNVGPGTFGLIYLRK